MEKTTNNILMAHHHIDVEKHYTEGIRSIRNRKDDDHDDSTILSISSNGDTSRSSHDGELIFRSEYYLMFV